MSPGTRKLRGTNGVVKGSREIEFPLLSRLAPICPSILSVWSRETIFWCKTVLPRAKRPASRIADLICALGTGNVKSIPRSFLPLTTRGAKEDIMGTIVELIDEVILNVEDETVIKKVREKVNAMMKEYPLFAD